MFPASSTHRQSFAFVSEPIRRMYGLEPLNQNVEREFVISSESMYLASIGVPERLIVEIVPSVSIENTAPVIDRLLGKPSTSIRNCFNARI